MRIISATDFHIQEATPQSRLDDYKDAMIDKLLNFKSIIAKSKAKMFIIPGDVFNVPVISKEMFGEVMEIFRSYNIPIYIVPGNHDMIGYNINSLKGTMLGLLFKSGIAKPLTREHFLDFTTKDGTEVHIEGQESMAIMDSPKGNIQLEYGLRNKKKNAVNVLVAHGYIFDKEHHPFNSRMNKPKYITDKKGEKRIRPWCTLLEDVPNDADLIIAGHYHEPIEPLEYNGTTLVNTGSFGRVEKTKRNPKFMIIDFMNGSFKLKIFDFKKAADSKTIFDFSKKNNSQNSSLNRFTKKVSSNIGKVTNFNDIVKEISNLQNIDQKICRFATDFINEELKIMNQKGSLSAQGYKEENQNIYIESVTLKNILSHIKTTVNFDSKMNIIVGEGNSGKSTILKAIRWVVEDAPKGDILLRTGKSSMGVSLSLSNGFTIQKLKTKGKGSKYIIYDTKTKNKINEFEKFKQLPMEISTVTQMPIVQLTPSYKKCLNISSQFDGPFLLSLSSNEKAAAIGRLIGIEPVDRSIKNIKLQNDNKKKEVKRLDTEIKEDKEILKNDFLFLDKTKEYIKEHFLQIKELEEKELKYNELNDLLTKKIRLKKKYEEYKKASKSIPNLNFSSKLLDKLKDLNNNKIELEKLINKRNKVNESLKTLEKELKSIPNLNQVSKELKQLITCSHKYEKVLELIKKKEKLNAKKFDLALLKLNNKTKKSRKLLGVLEEKAQQFLLLNKHLNQYNDSLEILNSYENKLKDTTEAKRNQKIKFKKFIDDIGGICPVCSQPLHVETFLKEEKHGIN
jgi:exonuclease SbcC